MRPWRKYVKVCFGSLQTRAISSLPSLIVSVVKGRSFQHPCPPATPTLPPWTPTLWNRKQNKLFSKLIFLGHGVSSQQKNHSNPVLTPSNEWQTVNSTFISNYSTFLSVSKVGFELEAIFLPHPPQVLRWQMWVTTPNSHFPDEHQMTSTAPDKLTCKLGVILISIPPTSKWQRCLPIREGEPSLPQCFCPCCVYYPHTRSRELFLRKAESSSFVPVKTIQSRGPPSSPLTSYSVHTVQADLLCRPSWLLKRLTLGLGCGHQSKQAHLRVLQITYILHIPYMLSTHHNHLCLWVTPMRNAGIPAPTDLHKEGSQPQCSSWSGPLKQSSTCWQNKLWSVYDMGNFCQFDFTSRYSDIWPNILSASTRDEIHIF